MPFDPSPSESGSITLILSQLEFVVDGNPISLADELRQICVTVSDLTRNRVTRCTAYDSRVNIFAGTVKLLLNRDVESMDDFDRIIMLQVYGTNAAGRLGTSRHEYYFKTNVSRGTHFTFDSTEGWLSQFPGSMQTREDTDAEGKDFVSECPDSHHQAGDSSVTSDSRKGTTSRLPKVDVIVVARGSSSVAEIQATLDSVVENLHGIDRTFVIADAEIDGDPKLTPEYPKR